MPGRAINWLVVLSGAKNPRVRLAPDVRPHEFFAALRMTRACVALFFTALSLAAAELPYTTEPAFGAQRFNQPVAIVSRPGDKQRIFVLEKPGRIMVLEL